MAPRLVPVNVAGTFTELPCPLWCIDPHTQPIERQEDLMHSGAEFRIQVRTVYGPRDLLALQLTQRPFDEEPPESVGNGLYVGVELLDGDVYPFRPDDLSNLLEDLREAGRLIKQVQQRAFIERRLGGAR